jgi:hypothetical protein
MLHPQPPPVPLTTPLLSFQSPSSAHMAVQRPYIQSDPYTGISTLYNTSVNGICAWSLRTGERIMHCTAPFNFNTNTRSTRNSNAHTIYMDEFNTLLSGNEKGVAALSLLCR